jgi:hypothetical protein
LHRERQPRSNRLVNADSIHYFQWRFPEVASRTFMIVTRYTLVGRLKEPDGYASKATFDADWNAFWETYEKPILAHAAKRGLSQHECEDVLQESVQTLIKRGLANFDPAKGRFWGHLFRRFKPGVPPGIVEGCVLNALARRSQDQTVLVSLNESHSDESLALVEKLDDPCAPDTIDEAERESVRALVADILKYLTDRRGGFRAKKIEIFKAIMFEMNRQDPGAEHSLAAERVAAIFHVSRTDVDNAWMDVRNKVRVMLHAIINEGLGLEESLNRWQARD